MNEFINVVKRDTFYGNIQETLETLLIDMLPKPGFNYDEMLKEIAKRRHEPEQTDYDPAVDENEEQETGEYPPAREYLDILLRQLKSRVGFNFIYLPNEERDQIARDILQTAIYIDPMKQDVEVENLGKTIRANPENIEQFIPGAIDHLMKENAPMSDEQAQNTSMYLLPVDILPGQRLVIGMIVHFLVRYLCTRLLQLALPEALIVKYDQISETYKKTYLVHQNHFEFKKLITKCVELQDESRDNELVRPTKLVCYTRTTSFILSLPNSFPANKYIQSPIQEEVREKSVTPVIHTEHNTYLFKLSAIRTQEQFMAILRDYFQEATKRVLIFVADMQHVTQQRINFVRIMIDEEESVAMAKIGPDFTLNKLVVILLHYPPTIFNRTLHKTRTGSFSRYPAHFLHGWDHYYLDNLQKQRENNPLNIQNWLSLTLLSNKEELERIKEPMLESLRTKLPTLTIDILSRIKFGTNLSCVFNSNSLDLYQRANLLEQLFRTEIGPMLCDMFISYWKSDFIREQIHNYANSIFQNLSNLSLTDLVVTSFWNLFTSFLTLMVYKMNEDLNLEVLFDQHEMDNGPVQYEIQPPTPPALCNEETWTLFIGILAHLNLPTMEEVKDISHILDAQVTDAIHIPKFPFSTFVARSFDNAIQSSIQEVNKNIIATQISNSSQGTNKHNQEDLTKLLSDHLTKNIQDYPLVQFILNNVGKVAWMDYMEDFAYDNISISSTDLLEKQDNNSSFLNLVRFWGNDFDPNDTSNALLKLHISSFSNPPDFSKLLYIFSSLETLDDSCFESMGDGMQSLMQQHTKGPSIFTHFLSTLFINISKILHTRPNAANIENFKKWVRVYINLIIQFSGSAHSDMIENTLTNDQKLKFAHIHSLFLIARYYHISDDFLINAFDLAIFIKLQLKGAYNIKMIFHKGLEKIEDACKTAPDAKMGRDFKVQFAEGILHHHIEQNNNIDGDIICWVLRSANRQSMWSGAGVRQTHGQAKQSERDERIIEPGLLTFRFYQYVVTKFLSIEGEDNAQDTAINITQFNRAIKQLIAIELFANTHASEPTEYIPFYYDAGPRSFIKCSADITPIMKQPLAHLYYQVSLDRLTQLHGDKNLLTLFKIFFQFLDTNLSIDKDTSYKVIARIEKQAFFQVILESYSKHFLPHPSNAILQLIEQHPECIRDIHSHIDDHNFGGAPLGGHSWSMLYLISNKFTSMDAFEDYLNTLNYSKDELPWVHKCVSQLRKIERQTIPQFPFMNIRDRRYKSYKEYYDSLRNIAYSTEVSEQQKLIDELSALTNKAAHDRTGQCYFRMYFWLGIYQEFYLKGVFCEELSRAIQQDRFASLGFSEGKKRIILCFLNTDNMIRSSETVESLNPDAPIYELKGNELKMKQRTGEKKYFLFDFFSLNQKDHDAIVLRSILCNLIAIFIGLPNNISHLSTLFLEPKSLMDTYIVSNLYPKPISKSLKYDCGCELNEDGSYGRPDYYSFDRKSFTLHSFYLMTLMNFGAFTVSLLTQPTAMKSISGHIFSEWKQSGLYCLSQLRTIWLHMQLQWELTQEELGEFLTNCFYDFFLLALEPNSRLSPTVFNSTEEVEKYEFAIHTQVYDKNLKRTKEVRDTRTQQPVMSEFSANVISFRKWYPTKVTFLHLQHTIESCRPVDIKLDSTVNNFAILHRFISERKRFRISSILIPNLLKFYRLFHTNLNYFITRKEAEERTVEEVINDINKKCKPLLNVEIKELYERVLHFYRVYVKVCRGLIGFGPCAAIRREDKFMPLERNTKFIRLLSVTEEPEIGDDALYLVIQDLVSSCTCQILSA